MRGAILGASVLLVAACGGLEPAAAPAAPAPAVQPVQPAIAASADPAAVPAGHPPARVPAAPAGAPAPAAHPVLKASPMTCDANGGRPFHRLCPV